MPVILLFMQIFSLLGVYALQAAQHQYQFLKDKWFYRQQEWKAIQALTDIENKLPYESCLVTVTSENLTQKSISWWQQVSCSGNLAGNEYYYLLELVGKNACLVMMVDAKYVIANYYRISLFWLIDKRNAVGFVLQSTFAAPTEEISSCKDEQRVLTKGRQTLHRLG